MTVNYFRDFYTADEVSTIVATKKLFSSCRFSYYEGKDEVSTIVATEKILFLLSFQLL